MMNFFLHCQRDLTIAIYTVPCLISDISIPIFSRQITFLALGSSHMVTSHSFNDLPKQLVLLSLASSKEIFDDVSKTFQGTSNGFISTTPSI
jgi:hypothetical protein